MKTSTLFEAYVKVRNEFDQDKKDFVARKTDFWTLFRRCRQTLRFESAIRNRLAAQQHPTDVEIARLKRIAAAIQTHRKVNVWVNGERISTITLNEMAEQIKAARKARKDDLP